MVKTSPGAFCFVPPSITAPTLAISTQDDGYDTYESARFIGYPTGGQLLVGHGQEGMAEIVRFLK